MMWRNTFCVTLDKGPGGRQKACCSRPESDLEAWREVLQALKVVFSFPFDTVRREWRRQRTAHIEFND